MILQRLKQDTRSSHQQIEELVDLSHRLSSPEGYRSVLEQFYGFYAPLELALAGVTGLELVLDDLVVRQKTGLLARDLGALGMAPDALARLPRCRELPVMAELAHAFGCLYVIEGATLGGQIISRQICAQFQFTPAHGAAFFTSYGTETGAMWRRFGSQLSAYATTPERELMIVDAALETFRTLRHWLARGNDGA
jgi:heme oxygenase (biliverdin-IX-beta and delta-forming)